MFPKCSSLVSRSMGRLGLVISIAVTLSYCGGGDDGEASDEADAPMIEIGAVPCGKNGCKLSDEFVGPGLRACCVDAFSGVCGVTTRKRDDCRELPKIEPRCPIPQGVNLDMYIGDGTGNGKSFGCCTRDNQCGLDTVGDYDFSPNLIGIPGLGFDQQEPGERCLTRPNLFCGLASSGVITKEEIDARSCDGAPLPLPEGCGEPFLFPTEPPPPPETP